MITKILSLTAIVLYLIMGNTITSYIWTFDHTIIKPFYDVSNNDNVTIGINDKYATFYNNSKTLYKVPLTEYFNINTIQQKFNDTQIYYEYSNNSILYNTFMILSSCVINIVIISTILEFCYSILTSYIFSKYDNLMQREIDDKNDDSDKNMFSILSGKITGDDYEKIFPIIKNIDTTFKDIIGQDSAKSELEKCSKYFKHKNQYIQAGYKLIKGILFFGPPGTGKTLMARAFANSVNYNFIATSSSDFKCMFVGQGVKRLQQLFYIAKKNSPCVIFIDEIDTMGRKRGTDIHDSESSSIVNELLVNMDGFKSSNDILIIGSTNKIELLDHALIRSGRFDRHISFDLPNRHERYLMLEYYLNGKKLHQSLSNNYVKELEYISSITPLMSGADIANIVNQSIALFMLRSNLDNVENISEINDGITLNDIENSIDDISIGSISTSRKALDKELDIVAYHEAGHALVSYMLINANNPSKVSIIPRGGDNLGYTKHEDNDNKLICRKELLAQMCVLIGGRIGESFITDITSGASNDYERLADIAYKYVAIYCFHNLSVNYSKNYKYTSQKIKEIVDDSVISITEKIYNFTKNLLFDNKEHLINLANLLRREETICFSDIDHLFNSQKLAKSIDYDIN